MSRWWSWRPGHSGAERRTDALSKERIVEAAIEILDADGESALTFRALAARLATGSRGDLLARRQQGRAAGGGAPTTSSPGSMTGVVGGAEPRAAIRAHRPRGVRRDRRAPLGGRPALPRAVAVRDAADLRGHRRAAGGARRSPTGAVRLRVRARELRPRPRRPVRRGRPAAPARAPTERRSSRPSPRSGRSSTPRQYPFVHQVAAQLPEHDDREQFLAGIDLILAGIEAARDVS